MTDNDDLRAIFPDPPPPAPKPRDAAIAVALARFDGTPAAARTARPPRRAWWKSLHRPQAGLIAATALVVAISLPIIWQTPPPLSPVPDRPQPTAAGDAEALGRQKLTAARGPELPAVTHPAFTRPTADATKPAIERAPARSNDISTEIAVLPRTSENAGAAAPATPPPAMLAPAPPPIVVQGRVASRAPQESSIAVSVIASEDHTSADAGSIVVTGARQRASKPVRRGDWNACTVNDPRRAVTRCRKLADSAAKAVRSQADKHLANGLQQAWDGNLAQARAAFDAAIAIAPDLSTAYLNRGLVEDRLGHRGAAIADLDRAIGLAPKSARAYYNRSVLLRKYGDVKRADADEQRAIDLDPRYRAILP